ncbi:MAG TPA: hypothetical protein VMD51_14060 [Mycobacterium sp.]|nr:hypothetical protein [Mycobacterium sp.]
MTNNISLPWALAGLIVAFGAAVALGLLVYRIEVQRNLVSGRDGRLVSDGMSGAVGFLGGATAFLLGVLMLASFDHYYATRNIVDSEAVAYAAAFASAGDLAEPDQERIHRGLVCLMRSVSTDSWAATAAERLTGAKNTQLWRARVRSDVATVEPKTPAQSNSLTQLQSELLDAAKSGQQRLLHGSSDLPIVLWLLVFVSIVLLVFVITLMLRPYPMMAAVSLGTILILSVAMVWVLAAFAKPFTQGDSVYIAPHALNGVMVHLEQVYPGTAWAPCERLAPE